MIANGFLQFPNLVLFKKYIYLFVNYFKKWHKKKLNYNFNKLRKKKKSNLIIKDTHCSTSMTASLLGSIIIQ